MSKRIHDRRRSNLVKMCSTRPRGILLHQRVVTQKESFDKCPRLLPPLRHTAAPCPQNKPKSVERKTKIDPFFVPSVCDS